MPKLERFGLLARTPEEQDDARHRQAPRKEAELLKILGDIRIGIWNFVLPFWNNKDLLKHARKKEGRGTETKPQHTKDFRISVITGEEFAVEIKALAKQDLYQFDVKEIPDSVPRSPNGWTRTKAWKWPRISPGNPPSSLRVSPTRCGRSS